VQSISGWGLPTMTDIGNDGCNFSYSGDTDCAYNVQTGTSEMANMFYNTLGNLAYWPPGDASCAGGPQSGWGLTNTVPLPASAWLLLSGLLGLVVLSRRGRPIEDLVMKNSALC
jgi:hypothetical protein